MISTDRRNKIGIVSRSVMFCDHQEEKEEEEEGEEEMGDENICKRHV